VYFLEENWYLKAPHWLLVVLPYTLKPLPVIFSQGNFANAWLIQWLIRTIIN
jgi:hypothetical protein